MPSNVLIRFNIQQGQLRKRAEEMHAPRCHTYKQQAITLCSLFIRGSDAAGASSLDSVDLRHYRLLQKTTMDTGGVDSPPCFGTDSVLAKEMIEAIVCKVVKFLSERTGGSNANGQITTQGEFYMQSTV